jgi:quinol monooxygenase YgiN
MAEPLVFTNTTAIKEGQLESWQKYFEEFAEYVEAQEPQLLHFTMYVDETGTEETIVQVHPDAASMRTHLAVMADHGHAAAEYLDFTRSTSRVYGAPDDDLIAQIRSYGIPVTVARPEGGFHRLPADR